MNYSDQSPLPNSGFKDMYISGINDPKPNLEANAQNVILDTQPPIIASSLDLESKKLETIDFHARIVKWTSLVLSIFSLLFLLPGAIPLVITFIFPVLGFIAANKYNECLIKFYTVYLVLINIVQIVVMAVIGGIPYIVLQCFVMLAEDIILAYNIKLSKEIAFLNVNELNILKNKQDKP